MLAHRVAVVTGATHALARAAVAALLERGAAVALVGADEAALARLVRAFPPPLRARLLAVAADLGDERAACSAAAAVTTHFGRVELVLHVTGGCGRGNDAVDECGDSVVDAQLREHVWSTLHVVRAFVPPMRARRFGRLVVASSSLATHLLSHCGPYQAARAAQEALILTLAGELCGTGVTANVLQVPEVNDEVVDHSANTELVEAALALCHDSAACIRGARLTFQSLG